MSAPFHLFDGLGIEIEVMVVDEETLDIRPWADRVMVAECGRPAAEIDRGLMSWNNELVAHVIEVKTTRPAPDPAGVVEAFGREWEVIRGHLRGLGAALLPGPVHPWMDPRTETVLWPHENREWYDMFDRLFDCRRHGWANLQSLHLNFPFQGDEEFARLHAAVRLLLPILPALAAGSPFLDGRHAGRLDERMEVYRHNADRIPAIAGRVIPEPVYSRAAYEEQILAPMYAAIAPLDGEGVLREPWLNSRGAIARFDRGSIEIRVIDSQECVPANLAVAWGIWHVLRALVGERWSGLAAQQAWPIDPLYEILLETICDGEAARVRHPAYLRQFGVADPAVPAGELWQRLWRECVPAHPAFDEWFSLYARRGTLARRLLDCGGPRPDREALRALYRRLKEGHRQERYFDG